MTGEHAQKRMAWRCRRGMLELDLLFSAFVRECLPHLNEAQMLALNRLLDLPDQQLWGLVSLQKSLAEDSETQVLNMLRSFAV